MIPGLGLRDPGAQQAQGRHRLTRAHVEQKIVDDRAVAGRCAGSAQVNQPEAAVDFEHVDVRLPAARGRLAEPVDTALARIDFGMAARPDLDQVGIGQGAPNARDGRLDFDEVRIAAGTGTSRHTGSIHKKVH